MTQEFIDMLYLLGWNHESRINDINHKYNIERIKELSLSQGVWTLVFPELEKYSDANEYLNEFMATVSNGIKKYIFQLQTISDLNEAGFNVCLLKGAAVALTYPEPSCRISGDTDILINPEQEQDIILFLKKYGYTIKPREKNDHHFKAYHPIGGLLEGHVKLYSIPTEKILLDGLEIYNEEWTTEQIEGFTIPILGLNDGLMYLTAHYIKHLVNEGGGVRQMMDVLLYIEHYRDKLDLKRYENLLKQLRYDKLFEVIKAIGAKYWGFDYPIKHENLIEKILTDSESGGIFGFDTNSRKDFYKIYCEKRSENRLKSKAIITLKGERGLKNLIFPSQKILLSQKEYCYVKNKLLVPVAWIHRFYIKILKRLKKREMALSSGIEDRLDMMKELDMIK